MSPKPFKRNSRTYQKLRKQFRATCKANRAPCHICGPDGPPIDYDAPRFTSQAFEVDHLIPVSTPRGESLPYDVSLWKPSHASCNRSRQDNPHDPQPPLPGQWVKPSWITP